VARCRDGCQGELNAFGVGQSSGRGVVAEVVGPLPHDLGVLHTTRRAAEYAEASIGDLMAVAVRTVQDVACPPIFQSGKVGKLVAQPGGREQTAGRDPLSVVEQDPEAVSSFGC
jgi:hypothetical protein